MVTQAILIRDKWRKPKRILLFFGAIFIILAILGGMFLFGFFSGEKTQVVLENPLKNIVFANTNEYGQVNEERIIEQAEIEFNEDYINYILVAIGVGVLHKSPLFENPLIEFNLGDETWSSEIIKGVPNTKKGPIDNEDLRIIISKEEAIKALLSDDIEQFMKNSVDNKNTQIEMVAGQTELFSKGYLDMYEQLTGESVELDE